MMTDKEQLFSELEAAGETLVRERLAQGVYAGRSKLNLINEWIRQKEDSRNQELSERTETREEESNRLAREANNIARDSNDVACEANDLARNANASASEANDLARRAIESSEEATLVAKQNKNIAVMALAISIITAIVSTIIALYKK